MVSIYRKPYILLLLLLLQLHVSAQFAAPVQKVSDSVFKPQGKLWGYVFGDFYYKAHGDSAGRGGIANQYTGVPENRNAFQIRRAYLGYNYDITPTFSAELLLAAEDNIANPNGTSSGDLLADNKLSFYIKFANIRWKNIWKGTDLVVGQSPTPTFSLLTEGIWGYRSIEKTIADIRKTPSFDLGAALQGKFDPATGNFGYNLMVGSGTGARPENDNFKWFYGDVYAKLLDKKLIIDLYADYVRMHWAPGFHHSRSMLKGFIAYTTPTFTIGTEAYINYGKQDVAGIKGSQKDTADANATGLSLYVRGQLKKDKLGYFVRMDKFNPDANYNSAYSSYAGFSPTYEPNNKETFVTAGLDFTPARNIHFMPNIWYNRYTSQQPVAAPHIQHDHDLVFRLSFFYSYGR